jgi:hypothetical protein
MGSGRPFSFYEHRGLFWAYAMPHFLIHTLTGSRAFSWRESGVGSAIPSPHSQHITAPDRASLKQNQNAVAQIKSTVCHNRREGFSLSSVRPLSDKYQPLKNTS